MERNKCRTGNDRPNSGDGKRIWIWRKAFVLRRPFSRSVFQPRCLVGHFPVRHYAFSLRCVKTSCVRPCCQTLGRRLRASGRLWFIVISTDKTAVGIATRRLRWLMGRWISVSPCRHRHDSTSIRCLADCLYKLQYVAKQKAAR